MAGLGAGAVEGPGVGSVEVEGFGGRGKGWPGRLGAPGGRIPVGLAGVAGFRANALRHKAPRVAPAPRLHVAGGRIDAGEIGRHPGRELVGVQPDVVVDAFRESRIHVAGARIQPVKGLDGAGVDFTGDEVRVKFVRSQMAGQGAAARDHSDSDGGAVVLRLDVAEAEAHRLQVIGQDVGDSVLGAVDLDARGEGVGGVGGLVGGRGELRDGKGAGRVWPVLGGPGARRSCELLRDERNEQRPHHRDTTSARSITAPSCTASTMSMPSTTTP